MMRTVPDSALDEIGFRPFGAVLRAGVGEVKQIRDGAVRLTRSAAELSHDPLAARPVIDIYDVAPDATPVIATRIERHPHSVQLFSPMDVGRWLVAVWPDGPEAAPRAFLAGPGEAVFYRQGLWHQGIVALDRPARFLSMMWRTDTSADAAFCDLAAPVAFDIPPR